MVRLLRRKDGRGTSATVCAKRGPWDVGLQSRVRCVLHQISGLPREWIACGVTVRNKGDVVGALSAHCGLGCAEFHAKSIDFVAYLILDTNAGDIKKQVR